jgi:hypothetical protein
MSNLDTMTIEEMCNYDGFTQTTKNVIRKYNSVSEIHRNLEKVQLSNTQKKEMANFFSKRLVSEKSQTQVETIDSRNLAINPMTRDETNDDVETLNDTLNDALTNDGTQISDGNFLLYINKKKRFIFVK